MATLNPTEPVKRLAVRIGEAADMLGISERKLYDLIYSGEIQSKKIGAARRVIVASIEAYLARK